MLRQAISSALGQRWPHVRVCVYDNASGDETEEVVATISRTDIRVCYHRHTENIGAHENFNFGVKAVKTPFFSILSDDDVLLPGFYEQAMGAFMGHPDAMFVAMPTLEVDDSGRVMEGSGSATYESRYYRAGEAYYGMCSGSVPGIWTGFVLRRKVVEEIGFVNDSAGPASDVAFIRHVLARYPGVVLPDIAALIRSHPASYSVKMSPLIKMNRSFWRAQAENIENDEHVPISIRSGVYSMIEKMYVRGLKIIVLSSLIDGRVDAALEVIIILRNLGYTITALVLRFFVICYEHIPFCSYIYRKAGLRRRNRLTRRLLDVENKYELQRDQFKDLLHCSIENKG